MIVSPIHPSPTQHNQKTVYTGFALLASGSVLAENSWTGIIVGLKFGDEEEDVVFLEIHHELPSTSEAERRKQL